MKRIIGWVLLLGTIISVGVALKFSALPVPSFLPDSLAEFWISSAEEMQKYVLLYDIAVGFIMSVLFFFVIEVIPNRIRIHKAKHLIKPQINLLVKYMEQIISVVIGKYSLNQNLKELAQKDFLFLDGETQYAVEEISYTTTTYFVKGNKKKIKVHQYGNINQLIKSNLKSILDNISIIKNYEFFYAGDWNLVECIRKIEGCDLIRFYLSSDKKKDSPCFLLYGTSIAMIDFVNLYLELLQRRFHTEYTATILDSKKETEEYRSDRENGVLLQYAIDVRSKRYSSALANPTAIISGSKYTTNILVSQLKRNLVASYISIDDVDVDKLNAFKYVVFIIDSSTKDKIIDFLNTNDITSGILLLTEQRIFRKSIKSKNENIIGKLFFKVSTHICGFPLLLHKQEPSEKSIVDIQSKIESLIYERN